MYVITNLITRGVPIGESRVVTNSTKIKIKKKAQREPLTA